MIKFVLASHVFGLICFFKKKRFRYVQINLILQHFQLLYVPGGNFSFMILLKLTITTIHLSQYFEI